MNERPNLNVVGIFQIITMVIGIGTVVADIPAQTRAALDDAGVGVEVMTTGAACRTFNVLLIEGRGVAAALIAVP